MENQGANLSSLLRRGGIFYHVPAKQPGELLAWLVNAVTETPAVSVKGELLLKAILEREELMPTAMGNGIALPHPRNPVIEKSEEQFAAMAFPENPLDWKALDGRPVNSVIMIVSSSARMHLFLLQRITFFCRNDEFCSLLNRRAPAQDILTFIEETEKGWELPHSG